MDRCLGMCTELAELSCSLHPSCPPQLWKSSSHKLRPETRPLPYNWEAFQRWAPFRQLARSLSLLGPCRVAMGAAPTFSIFCAIRGAGGIQLAVHVAWDDIPDDNLPIVTGGGEERRWTMSHTENVFLVSMVLGKIEGNRVRNPISSHPQLTCPHSMPGQRRKRGSSCGYPWNLVAQPRGSGQPSQISQRGAASSWVSFITFPGEVLLLSGSLPPPVLARRLFARSPLWGWNVDGNVTMEPKHWPRGSGLPWAPGLTSRV